MFDRQASLSFLNDNEGRVVPAKTADELLRRRETKYYPVDEDVEIDSLFRK